MEINETTVRLSLHLLGASVWVGGQIALGALVPVARQAGPEIPRALARGVTAGLALLAALAAGLCGVLLIWGGT